MSGYVVALTGGVASGKSAVAACFEALGVVVVDADVAARDAVAVGSDGLAEVVAAFGASVLDADGALDRPAMRRRIFDEPTARVTLESIIHPRVRLALQAACAAAPGAYVIAAIPLLAESGGRVAYPWVDRIAVVDVPIDVQQQRLLARDGIDVHLARRMIEAQASREERLAIAEDVLVNVGTLAELDGVVAGMDRRYRLLAG